MRGGDRSSRRSALWLLRLMGYASILLAVVGFAAIGVSVWMRARSPFVQAAWQPAPSRALPVVGGAQDGTRSVTPSPTTQPTLSSTAIPPSVTPSATPIVPTVTPSPSPQPTETSTMALTATPSPSPAPPTPTPAQVLFSVAQVLAAVPGSEAAIAGTVVEISRFASGVRCTLEDASGRLTLWLPQQVWAHLDGHEAWGVGCTVRAAGIVQLYRQEIELVPQRSVDVSVLGRAPTAPMVRVGDLGQQDVGRLVAVQGTIIEVWPFSQGVKYLFDDGSGRIVVLLWQGVYNDVPGKEGLTAGMTIRVTGVVQEYNGQLEIIPGLGHEVSVQ